MSLLHTAVNTNPILCLSPNTLKAAGRRRLLDAARPSGHRRPQRHPAPGSFGRCALDREPAARGCRRWSFQDTYLITCSPSARLLFLTILHMLVECLGSRTPPSRRTARLVPSSPVSSKCVAENWTPRMLCWTVAASLGYTIQVRGWG